jgi:maltose O-acetyltransferase
MPTPIRGNPIPHFSDDVIRHFLNFLLRWLPPSRLFALRRWLLRCAGIRLADDVCFCGGGWIYGPGQLSIGAGSWLSPGCVFFTHQQAPIRIGQRCDIGPSVEFITGGHLVGHATRRAGEGTARPIEIGDGSWIGARSVILGGVRIGAGCVVAAGSVVTRDVPDNVLVAGVPARIKRVLDTGTGE